METHFPRPKNETGGAFLTLNLVDNTYCAYLIAEGLEAICAFVSFHCLTVLNLHIIIIIFPSWIHKSDKSKKWWSPLNLHPGSSVHSPFPKI